MCNWHWYKGWPLCCTALKSLTTQHAGGNKCGGGKDHAARWPTSQPDLERTIQFFPWAVHCTTQESLCVHAATFQTCWIPITHKFLGQRILKECSNCYRAPLLLLLCCRFAVFQHFWIAISSSPFLFLLSAAWCAGCLMLLVYLLLATLQRY